MKFFYSILLLLPLKALAITDTEYKQAVAGSWVGDYKFDDIKRSWCANHFNDGSLKIYFLDESISEMKKVRKFTLSGTWVVEKGLMTTVTQIESLNGKPVNTEQEHDTDKYKILSIDDKQYKYEGQREGKTVFITKRVENCN